ncbi:BREX-1 system adenine-specific DNA-methyltransferase PglX [Cerasibacillus sp. JNUCC 74]
MNKTELKNFAVEARRDLLEKVALKAEQYGITKENPELTIEENYGQLIVNGKTFPLDLKHALRTLQNRLNTVGYEQLIEEVAYTWFNRIIAIRYMEVNNYLPDRVNVLSSSSGKNEPDILLQYETMNLDVNYQDIHEFLKKGEHEQAYRQLFVAQCNSLSNSFPILFEKIKDYSELLLPDYLLDSEFIISKLINNTELVESFREVEVIGWIYQYYNSEVKDKVYENLKRNKRVQKNEIPAATQLFTPKWVVKYMVDNSLGKVWLEANPDSDVKSMMKYFVNPANQENITMKELVELEYKEVNLEELTILDPCVGSGHILLYAFDLLYEMYKEEGYPSNEIPQLILNKNLYGLDIDQRATQLASFALIMKAREKSRRIFKNQVVPNIYEIKETNNLDKIGLVKLISSNEVEENELKNLLEIFHDAKNYGSLIKSIDIDCEKYLNRIKNIKECDDLQLGIENYYLFDQLDEIEEILKQVQILNSKYDITVTNPPYMGARNINSKLSEFLKINYPISKFDTFSAMMERMGSLTKENGIIANVTMQSWMFLSSFEKFRDRILNQYSILSMVHMDNMVMGIAFGTAATIFRKKIKEYKGVFQYIKYDDLKDNEPFEFPVTKNRFTYVSSEDFKKLPGSQISYWASKNVLKLFKENEVLGDHLAGGNGMTTGENDKFLRLWFEIDRTKMNVSSTSADDAIISGAKWFPYIKGGSYRKWYGNLEYVVNWKNNGEDIKNKGKCFLRNKDYYFEEGISWSKVSSGDFSVRYTPKGTLFDVAGISLFSKSESSVYEYLAFLNSKVASHIIKLLSSTINYESGTIKSLPFIKSENNINDYVEKLIGVSKLDWDSFETSWNFKKHPFLQLDGKSYLLKDIFMKWKNVTKERFTLIKENEEQINTKLINLYNLGDELNPSINEEKINIYIADSEKDTKNFLSYFVGCLMGRYSLDIEGLAYAGGDFDESKYKTFKPNPNGLILLTDDHYFENDIIVRLREFLSVAFSPDTVDENMRWLAESLKMKKNESPEERLRRYFLDEFFKDHCKTYQKRPIYWLVDSGKQKGLRTLIYLHRYQPDTMATIRFDHLQEIQSKYQNEIEMIDTRLANTSLSATDRRNLEKAKIAYQKKIEELQEFDKHLAVYANEQIDIDLDDGVKVNYAKFDKVLTKIK